MRSASPTGDFPATAGGARRAHSAHGAHQPVPRRSLRLALWAANGLVMGVRAPYIAYAPGHAGLLFTCGALGMPAASYLVFALAPGLRAGRPSEQKPPGQNPSGRNPSEQNPSRQGTDPAGRLHGDGSSRTRDAQDTKETTTS